MKNALALVVAALFLAVFVGALWGGRPSADAVASSAAAPGDALWHVRTLEVLVQGALLLAGVLGILALVAGHGRREGEA